MYQVGKKGKNKRRRAVIWLAVLLCLVGAATAGAITIRQKLKSVTTVSQSRPVVNHVSYDNKTKHYDEADFGIDIPNSWQKLARPAGPYNSFTWQSGDRGAVAQVITIYEDTIPLKFAVNRVLTIHGEVDHVSLNGTASDNCAGFTNRSNGVPNQVGIPAKWQGVDFLCDESNQQRDVIGTSSVDGINTVILKSPGGAAHKFFFTYTDYSVNPDYSVFYIALNSFHMQ